MGSKACILCDAHPPPALTGEHLWPDWYNQQQPDFRYELAARIDKDPVEVRPTKDMNLKPRVLCDPCNTQWGSRLESRVSPILTPMMRGEPRRLDRDEAQLISAWVYLKAMVSEYLISAARRDRRFHGIEQGKHLRATLRPSDGAHIWIGRYVGSCANAGWITDRAGVRDVSDDPAAVVFWRSVVYTIGQVLFHLFAVSQPIPTGDVKDGRVQYEILFAPADWDSALVPIWEPQSSVPADWPPEKVFDDAALKYLVERGNVQEPPSPETPPEVTETEADGM